MSTNSRLGWLNLPYSPTLPPPVSAKHQVVKLQGMSLRKRYMAMEEKVWFQSS